MAKKLGRVAGVTMLLTCTTVAAEAPEVAGNQSAAAMMLIAEPGSSEEIVVTARRREESEQTVPISLNAFSATRLTEASIQTLNDLTAISPGLRFRADGGAELGSAHV